MSVRHTKSEVSQELTDLAHLDLDDLRRRWRRLNSRPVPEHFPRHLLVRLIAYRIQAETFGDLDSRSTKLLRELAQKRARRRGAAPGVPTLESLNLSSRGARSLAPGTVIGREHGGIVHQVMVLTDGFAWNGTTYRSLSEVAYAITGTRWNGPRFFGLKSNGKLPVGNSTGGAAS